VRLEGKARPALGVAHGAAEVEEASQLLLAAFDWHVGRFGEHFRALPQRAGFSAAERSLLVGAQAEGLLDPVGERVTLECNPMVFGS
jgi:hypothetical protein